MPGIVLSIGKEKMEKTLPPPVFEEATISDKKS